MSSLAAAISRARSRSERVVRRCRRESGGVNEVRSEKGVGAMRVILEMERDDRGRIHSLKKAAEDFVV